LIKKVLMISYLFPPLDCGVGRQIKFAKYLPLFGWMPTVLTVNRSFLRPRYDPSRVKEVSSSMEIFRTYSLEIRPLQRWLPAVLNRLFRLNPKWFQPVDDFVGWLPFAVREGSKILRKGYFDLIFSTSMPNTCHLVAYILKKKFGIPWIADFRDPWTQNPYVTYPKPISKIEEPMEQAVIRTADKITTTNPFFTEGFTRKYSNEPKEKFVTIIHGFDPDDFQKLETTVEHKFVMTYTGSFYGLRKPDTFLKAVSDLLSKHPDLKDQLRIRFVGSGGRSVEATIHRYGLDDTVEVYGQLSHKKALEHLHNSSLLLLITGIRHESTAKDSSGRVFDEFPGKLVEYLAIGKPILALATSEGSVARIIKSTRTGIVVHPSDTEGIQKAILDFYDLHKRGHLKMKPDLDELKKYNIQMAVKRLSEIFTEVAHTQ